MTIILKGDKEIRNALKHLPDVVQHRVLSAANFAAAKPLVEKEKLLAPEGPTGNLVDSIGAVKTSLAKASKLGEVIVGPRRRGYKGFAGHLVEYGTRRRKTKSGANRGVMPKKPFARPAFQATRGQVESSIAGQLSKAFTRTMKRYLRGS
jgi:HK97 gp10 family phage protein